MFIQNGGEQKNKKMSRVQSNWGRNQHSKAGIYSGRASPSLDHRKSHSSSSACVMYSVMCTLDLCVHIVYATGIWKLGLIVLYTVRLHLSIAAGEASFLNSSFIPFHFSPNNSPRLPSSHPNQRTHRLLLGTPCPGNPLCTARYLQFLQSP